MWQLRAETYLTCCNKVKSVQKPHDKHDVNMNIQKNKGSREHMGRKSAGK